MKKNLVLEIVFKDGRSVTFQPTGDEGGKAIKDFKEGKEKIELGTLEGGLEKTVFDSSEIRAIVPRWVKTETEKTVTRDLIPPSGIEKKKKPRGRTGV